MWSKCSHIWHILFAQTCKNYKYDHLILVKFIDATTEYISVKFITVTTSIIVKFIYMISNKTVKFINMTAQLVKFKHKSGKFEFYWNCSGKFQYDEKIGDKNSELKMINWSQIRTENCQSNLVIFIVIRNKSLF